MTVQDPDAAKWWRAAVAGVAIVVIGFLLLSIWAFATGRQKLGLDFESTASMCALTGMLVLLAARWWIGRSRFRIDSMRKLVMLAVLSVVLLVPTSVMTAYLVGPEAAWINAVVFAIVIAGGFTAGWLRLRRRRPC